jgi:hypothetical protein
MENEIGKEHRILRTQATPRQSLAIPDFAFEGEHSVYLKTNHSIPLQLQRLAEAFNMRYEDIIQAIIYFAEAFSKEAVYKVLKPNPADGKHFKIVQTP